MSESSSTTGFTARLVGDIDDTIDKPAKERWSSPKHCGITKWYTESIEKVDTSRFGWVYKLVN